MPDTKRDVLEPVVIYPDTNDDYFKDQLINVRLRRKDYELLRDILSERQAQSWLANKIKSWWVFALGSGVIVIWSVIDRIKGWPI